MYDDKVEGKVTREKMCGLTWGKRLIQGSVQADNPQFIISYLL